MHFTRSLKALQTLCSMGLLLHQDLIQQAACTAKPTASCFNLFFYVDLNKAAHFSWKERERE